MSNRIITSTFRRLSSHPCWGLNYERQLNLSMNFGKPSLKIREPYVSESKSEAVRRFASQRRITVRGQWFLWIYCCYWRMSLEDGQYATGSSSERQIGQALAQLDGQKLVAVQIEPRTGMTVFTFDLGAILRCRRFDKVTDDELWILYKPGGYCLSVRGNGSFSHLHSTSFSPHDEPTGRIL